jgi:ABC-type uncharacterized transport system auxiliary subunit
MMATAGRVLLLVACLSLAGCLFRNAAEPRFYRPASSALDGAAAAPARDDGTNGAASRVAAGRSVVRLEPVAGTPFLRERIAWRSSDVEYGLYEQRRWSELPSSYVERALTSALRATPDLRLTDAFDAPTLRVNVVSFDDVLAPAHVARVTLAVSLRARDRSRLLDRTFSAEEPVAGDGGSATATAMGVALDRAVAEVASAVAAELSAR